MTPGYHDFVIYQGATFALQFTYKTDGNPIDLTGYTARMQLRETYQSASPAIALTSDNGRLEITAATGTITARLDAEETAGLKARRYVYDIELVNGETVSRILQGTATVDPEATK